MRPSLKNQIYEYIKKNNTARPNDLKAAFSISAVAIHKHLKALLAENKIQRQGKPPLVFYSIPSEAYTYNPVAELASVDAETLNFVKAQYGYVSPTGEIVTGVNGFVAWANSLHLNKQIPDLLREYRKVRETADRFIQPQLQLIDATEKLRNTFATLHLSGVFYKDFYSLPKFGKTLLGSFVLFAKQSQHPRLIWEIATKCGPALKNFLLQYSIDTVAFVPHSIPRKLQFLQEFEKNLRWNLPKIEIVKAYSGDIQVAQKSLSKLEERILNAQNTFFLKKNPVPAKRVLLIDDAVGSGATMNEIAAKIRQAYQPEVIFGFAIVGSYKGFEVIREV